MKIITMLVLLFAAMTATLAQGNRVELRANMTGGAGSSAKGKAVWKTRDAFGQFQAQLQVEGERLTPNTAYQVVIGSNAPFDVMTDVTGRFSLALRFTTAARPTIVAGTAVALVNLSGVSVLGGAFLP